MQEEEKAPFKLETIGDGALLEKVNAGLAELVRDIADVNTTTAARVLTVKITLKPTEDRTFMGVSGSVGAKLGGSEPVEITADIGFDKQGRPAAFHRGNPQRQIPFNLTRINQGEEQR